jgi:bifunctional ADP-heptose synthase (sugar kinase/adenylyltransferase)
LTPHRLDQLLDRFRRLRIAVCGDFFLDKYLLIDPALAEVSIETGLTAHQVTALRCQAGAAGTVCNNLAALGVGRIEAVGYRGPDGEGFELRRALRAIRVSTTLLTEAAGRLTPTYTKPLVQHPGEPPTELERLDHKNRTPTPPEVEQRVIESIEIAASRCDALVIADQVEEPNHGVITDRVRDLLAELGRVAPELVILTDSRRRIGRFRQVSVKPNVSEAQAGFGLLVDPETLASSVSRLIGRPAFVTLGSEGAVAAIGDEVSRVPGVPVPEPLDICGAGDSFCAGSVCALAAGASPAEAAQVGCLVASLTVQQIGTTGTATPAQVRRRLVESPYLNAAY